MNPLDAEVEVIELDGSLLKVYLRKVERAEELKDELDKLEDNYYRRAKDASFRNHHHIPISVETTNFLQEYPEMHAEALDALHAIEGVIFDLREECSSSTYLLNPITPISLVRDFTMT